MRKTRTRILSLLLALALCLSLLPAAALAAGEPALFLDPEQSASLSSSSTGTWWPGENPSPDSVLGQVTFDLNGAGAAQTVTVKQGAKRVEPPQDPTLPGYRFLGWYMGDVGGDQYLRQYVSIDHYYIDGGLPQELTFYAMWEKTDLSGFTITFDANGGSVSPASKQTGPDGRVSGGYPTPTRDGYTFLGWFTDGDGYQPSESDVWGGDQTLVARWEQAAAARVTFYPNGGRITSFKGVTVPEKKADPGPFYIDEAGNTGVDMNSGWGWTVTGEKGLVSDTPTVERAGYAFGGWYVVSGPQANQAGDGKLTDFTGLTQLGTAPFYPQGVELAARWTAAELCTVTFDLNGAVGTAPAPQKVAKGRTVELPVLQASGATFKGWGWLADGKTLTAWKAEDPVTGDLTLYAMWELAGEDTYSFSNSDDAFDTYRITGTYFDYLTEDVGPTWKGYMEEDYLGDGAEWGGSCFGMSAVYCMARGGVMDLSVFQSGTRTLRGLKVPRQSQNVQDLINFYMMAQSTIAGSRAKSAYLNLDQTKRYQNIVTGLTAEKGFSVLGFQYGRYGHAIVARSIQKSGDGYHIEIWDPNNPEDLGELVISSDFSTARFTDETYGAARYNRDSYLKYIMPLSTRGQTYDAKNLQSVFGKRGTTSTHASDTGLYQFSSSTGDFTVTAADGRSAVVKGGTQISGNLTLLDNTIDGAPAGAYRFSLEASDLDQVTITLDGTDPAFTFVSDDIMARASADTLRSIVIDGDTVTATCASPAEQEITVVSEQLGTTWNKVTVSGRDTEISLTAASGQVRVSSRNNVPVTVEGGNVGEQGTSGRQTVTAASGGTAVAMSSLVGAGAQQPAGDNPFTDVSAGAYYYDAVLWAVKNGVTSGTSAATFSPNNPCTRGQIVTFLWRTAGSPKLAGTANPFTDVKEGAYYYDAVLWAVEKGITGGTSATTFSPNNPCTRGQTVTFLWRAAGSPKAAGTSSAFTDVTAGAYYYDAVLWAVEQKITSGTSAAAFSPASTVTRGQTVTFLYRSQGK